MNVKLVCDFCGKEFYRKKSQVKEHNYCSRKCLGQSNRERFRQKGTRICDNCGKEYWDHGKHKYRNQHRFCSKECAYEFKTKKVEVLCDWCGKPFLKKKSAVAKSQHNFCDKDCYLDFRNFVLAGAKNQRVCNQVIYRILAESKLGRPLTPDEHVHHIDGNHLNNDPDNLMVLSNSEHMKIHAAKKRRDKYGRFVK